MARLVAEHFADHDGVITRGAALKLGMSSSAVARRVRDKLWIQLSSGVYLSATHTFTAEARMRAAVGATDGAVDGPAAAWWHGIVESPPDSVSVTVPRQNKRSPTVPYSLELHRRDLLPADLEVVRGLTVTTAPLTALEAASTNSAHLDRALQEGIVTIDGLTAALTRNAGRHGMAEARRLLDVVAGDTESEAERRFQSLLESHHITGWCAQFPFGVYAIDFAFPEQRVAVEIDGWAFHRTADRAANDAGKQNRLTLAGWRVLRFGWHRLDGDGEAVITDVLTAVNAAAA